MFSNISFAYPWAFLLLLFVPLLLWWHYSYSLKKRHSINFPSLKALDHLPISGKERIWKSLPIIRSLVIVFVVIAIARPQSSDFHEDYSIEGVDIVLANDISGSMLAEDLTPNRLEAAKEVAAQFIDSRPNDRIGLVAFSGSAFTQCPLTADHAVLKSLLKNLRSGIVQDGTAIGDGVSIAVDRLKDSKAVSKIVILLTDGINNSGYIDPLMSASIANTYGVRVYAIGVGTLDKKARYPIQTPFGKQYEYVEVKLDEALMQEMAENTGGRYFRASDNKSLEQVYKEIDKLEKTRFNVAKMSNMQDLFAYPLFVALFLLLIEIVFKYFILKVLP